MGRRRSDVGVKVRQLKGAWWVVVHHAGKRRIQRVGAGESSRRTAEKVAEQLRAKLVLGQLDLLPPTMKKLTVETALRNWLRIYRPTLSASYERTAAGIIDHHLVPFFGPRLLAELREPDLLEFIGQKLDSGLSPATVSNSLSVLRRVLNLAAQEGHVTRNPAARIGQLMRQAGRRVATEVTRVDAWTRDEVATLLALAREHEPRFYPALLFLLSTGAHRGEALGLRWEDILFSDRRVLIRRALVHGQLVTPKSGRARHVVLSRDLTAALEALFEERRRQALARGWPELPSHVFCAETGGPLDERNLVRSWHRLRRRAQVHGVRPFKLHCARHTFASLALAAGKSLRWVAAQLGHANPELTLRVYAHVMREEETDLRFLELEAPATAPDGTQAAPRIARARETRRPGQLTRRRASRFLERETGFEPATLSLGS